MCSCSCSYASSSSLSRCFGVFLVSIFKLPTHKQETDARWSAVFSKPRTPLDCPICRQCSSDVRPAPAPVRPWGEVKSCRGAPKRVNTAGFACPNQQCVYFGITQASIHALVADGKHGRVEQIQTFCCQACRTMFSARRHTPLYWLKTPSQQVAVVLSALAERLDASATERVFGCRQATTTTWLSRRAARSKLRRTGDNVWFLCSSRSASSLFNRQSAVSGAIAPGAIVVASASLPANQPAPVSLLSPYPLFPSKQDIQREKLSSDTEIYQP